MPMPPALEKELIRQRTPAQYEGAPTRRKKKKLFKSKKVQFGSDQVEDVTDRMIAEGKERASRVREAATAIESGRAEAHPIIEQVGFHGPVVMEEPEVRRMGDIFTKSLVESYWRRNPRKKAPRMLDPRPNAEFARR